MDRAVKTDPSPPSEVSDWPAERCRSVAAAASSPSLHTEHQYFSRPASTGGSGDEQCLETRNEQTGARSRGGRKALRRLVVIHIALSNDIDLSLAAHDIQLPSLRVEEQVIGITANRLLRHATTGGDVVDLQRRWRASCHKEPMFRLVQ